MAVQAAAPSLNSHLPVRVVVLDGLQTITLRGNGFRPGATVTVGSTWGSTTLSGAAVRWVSSSTIKILANVGTGEAQWWARVNNSDGTKSGVYRFDVKSAAGYTTGTYIGELKDIAIYANASLSGAYQCVDYIKRYYATRFPRTNNGKGIGGLGSARYWYTKAADVGLSRAPNGGTNGPRAENIIVFDDGKIGHVGIISEVGSNYLIVAHQNWLSGGVQVAYKRIPMTVSGGRYTVSAWGTYKVTGWAWPDASKYSK
jgi:surface antigen